MNKPHKHAELIKAWADGAEIECYNGLGYWFEDKNPDWHAWNGYRIKPDEPRLRDMYVYKNASMGTCWIDMKNPSEAEMGNSWEYVGRIQVYK